MDRIYKYTS
jgi:hypothetical protein